MFIRSLLDLFNAEVLDLFNAEVQDLFNVELLSGAEVLAWTEMPREGGGISVSCIKMGSRVRSEVTTGESMKHFSRDRPETNGTRSDAVRCDSL